MKEFHIVEWSVRNKNIAAVSIVNETTNQTDRRLLICKFHLFPRQREMFFIVVLQFVFAPQGTLLRSGGHVPS